MGLFGFGKKKKIQPIKTFPSKPSFYDEENLPTLESPKLESPEFPIYEEFEEKPVSYQEESLDNIRIPKRESKINYKESTKEVPEFNYEPEETEISHITMSSEKPLFIKVDNYKEAIELLEKIGLKLKEASGKLDELIMLRDDEDKTLQEWRDDIEKIKESLLKVDKNLFEK